MDAPSLYQNLSTSDEDFMTIIPFISTRSPPQIKGIVTACRALCLPMSNLRATTLYQKSTGIIFSYKELKQLEDENHPLFDTVRTLRHFIESPFLAGLIMNLCYANWIGPDVSDAIKLDSIETELEVLNRPRRDPAVFWDPIFNEEELHRSILPGVAANPLAMQEIHFALADLRDEMDQITVFPHSTLKGISTLTSEDFKSVRSQYLPDEPYKDHITTTDLLSMYVHNGVKCDSTPSEVRQQWAPTLLKPRTYFANGGRDFFASTYLRNFFNELADRFESSHRIHRVDVNRLLAPGPDGHFLLYDYSAFTSNFSEQIHFLRKLAEYFRDTFIYIVAENLALDYVSLGDLIEEYADTVNDMPEFTIADNLNYLKGAVLVHACAGFLGVYGNLMTCTIPHCWVARQLVDEWRNLSTAGDDGAIGYKDQQHRAAILKALLLLGNFAPDKLYDSTELSVYLKRPFLQYGKIGQTVPILLYPTLVFVSGPDETIDKRFAPLDQLDYFSKRKIATQSLWRWLHLFSTMGIDPTIREQELLQKFYSAALCTLGDEGTDMRLNRACRDFRSRSARPLPPAGVNMFDPSIKDNDRRYFRTFNKSFRPVPPRGVIRCEYEQGLQQYQDLYCNSSPLLKFLCRVGYIEKMEVGSTDDEYIDLEDRNLMDLYLSQGPPIYTYKVHKSVSCNTLENMLCRPNKRFMEKRLKRAEFDAFTRYTRDRSRYKDPDAPKAMDFPDFPDKLCYEEDSAGLSTLNPEEFIAVLATEDDDINDVFNFVRSPRMFTPDRMI